MTSAKCVLGIFPLGVAIAGEVHNQRLSILPVCVTNVSWRLRSAALSANGRTVCSTRMISAPYRSSGN